mmetsp:Transcript_15082/g.39020  ORF Transcript_15082/g.39020 Transcript_15082/m.39020 type:complete len:324 (+) Transcript_15082:132-1103(+)
MVYCFPPVEYCCVRFFSASFRTSAVLLTCVSRGLRLARTGMAFPGGANATLTCTADLVGVDAGMYLCCEQPGGSDRFFAYHPPPPLYARLIAQLGMIPTTPYISLPARPRAAVANRRSLDGGSDVLFVYPGVSSGGQRKTPRAYPPPPSVRLGSTGSPQLRRHKAVAKPCVLGRGARVHVADAQLITRRQSGREAVARRGDVKVGIVFLLPVDAHRLRVVCARAVVHAIDERRKPKLRVAAEGAGKHHAHCPEVGLRRDLRAEILGVALVQRVAVGLQGGARPPRLCRPLLHLPCVPRARARRERSQRGVHRCVSERPAIGRR